MAVHKIKSLEQYHHFLRAHPAELKALFNDVLIQVTSFFRDPLIFQLLKKKFIPQLISEKGSDEPVRVWVPACATGEEVYSLAIVLLESADGKKKSRPIQIFGTDISDAALEKARAGFYPEAITKEVSGERLQRFFETVPGGYRIREEVRDVCVFARQNLISDPPFSNLDLISCRNALIYFSPVLQQKLMPIFHFALRQNGLLMLGTSETVGKFTDLFGVAHKAARLYSKKVVRNKIFPDVGFLSSAQIPARKPVQPPVAAKSPKHLDPRQLRATFDEAIRKAIGMGPEHASLIPLTIPQTGDRIYLVVVDPKEPREVSKKGALKSRGKSNERTEIIRLRRELLTMRESLHAVIEQEEVTNEELRAANEEIVSSNEELQSSNEELETTKEELQSTNEELAMLNNELQIRNAELERANVISSQFQAIVESSDDAIISKNLNSIIQTWNAGAEKIFGYQAHEVIGKPITILIPENQEDEEPRILARLRAGERIDHYETIRRRKDGTLINISLTVSPVKNLRGEVIGASKIARDITEKKRSEAELRMARDEAEKASRAKDYFLAALSHELRTPLSPVLLVASDAAANPDLPPGVRANFDMIRRNVELEARLIDDLLDMTRITTGKLKTERRNINVHAVLETAISMVLNEIEQKGIMLKLKFQAMHSMASGDTMRLQQVFWNVLKNAVKFTPPRGAITVETKTEKDEYVVSISDSGIGMTERELEMVFDAFKQGDHSGNAHRFGGLGLGLTISKNLVELHSGKIEAASPGRNQGSTFTIRIPLTQWHEPLEQNDSMEPNNHEAHRPARAHILIVEDDESTRSVLLKVLSNRNYKVTEADSAGKAAALAIENQFDLIISDIGLPDGDGYELFRTIREKSPSIKGIALTGYGAKDDFARSKDSGFDAQLTKPVKIQALEAALVHLFDSR